MNTTSLGLTTQTVLGKEEYKKTLQVINTLYDNNDALEFRLPVDYKSLGLNDYLTYVKTPMDLGTVKRNLKNSKYQYVEEMLNDIQLVWDNCKSYNQEQSWIYKQADKLEKFFRRSIKNFLPTIPFKPAVKKPSGLSQIGQSYGPYGQYPVDDVQSDLKDDEISYQDKLTLSNKVKYLSQEKLGEIIKLIQEECSDAFVDVDKDRCQILVDNITKEVKIEDWAQISGQKLQKKVKHK